MAKDKNKKNKPAKPAKGKVAPKAPKAKKLPENFDWRKEMEAAAKLRDSADSSIGRATSKVWNACRGGVTEWLSGNAADDGNADELHGEFIELYGKARRGDCSKMRTVALAARDHGLNLDEFESLSKAYASARALVVVKQQHADEDEIGEATSEAIAKTAPKTATSVDSAAMILLSRGFDETARALVEALEANSPDPTKAALSLIRAISEENTARAKAAKAADAEAKAAARAEAADAAKAETKGKDKAKTKAVTAPSAKAPEKSAPKDAPKATAPKAPEAPAPKAAPKGAPKAAPKGAPKAAPKAAPKVA